MGILEFSPVRLVTNRYTDKGVGIGALGFVLEVYDGAYEVEFSRSDGTTIAWFAVDAADLQLADDVVQAQAETAEVGNRRAS